MVILRSYVVDTEDQMRYSAITDVNINFVWYEIIGGNKTLYGPLFTKSGNNRSLERNAYTQYSSTTTKHELSAHQNVML